MSSQDIVENGNGGAQKTFLAIILVITIIISVIDTAINTGDAVVDAVTVGVGGAITNTIDLLTEPILEFIQVFLIALATTLFTPYSLGTKALMIFIAIVPAVLDIILTILGYFPYFDIVETIVGIIGEIVQNLVLLIPLIFA